ncbi:MAG: hypothetical protein KGS61_12920 [Verrucomicrobia bacterium]|nr:hypothetical protein [Verrucomicrobiota bacterium]
MKISDDFLQRLLRAAARARPPEPAAPPFALETRTLEAWRRSRLVGDWTGLLRLFRIGLGFASVLMVVIIALSVRDLAREPAREVTLPNVIVNEALDL